MTVGIRRGKGGRQLGGLYFNAVGSGPYQALLSHLSITASGPAAPPQLSPAFAAEACCVARARASGGQDFCKPGEIRIAEAANQLDPNSSKFKKRCFELQFNMHPFLLLCERAREVRASSCKLADENYSNILLHPTLPYLRNPNPLREFLISECIGGVGSPESQSIYHFYLLA